MGPTPTADTQGTQRKTSAHLHHLLWFFAAYTLALTIALRAQLLSGWDMGFGDRADGIIEISLLEHWHRLFTTDFIAWRQTSYFYPYTNTLGYNDGYFLFGVVYSFWRQWFDPFLSDMLNVMTWKSIGFFASYMLVARVLCWERPVALLIALLFTIANGMAVQAVHAQLQAIALLPIAGSLVVLLLRAELSGSGRRAGWLATALAALLGLWFMTGYYLAWFSLYFCVMTALCWLWTIRTRPTPAIAAIFRNYWRTTALFSACFIIAVIPCLTVYLPKLGETGGHYYAETLRYLANPIDIANVGQENYLWGWIFRGIADGAKPLAVLTGLQIQNDGWITGEHETGFPLILLCLALAAIWAVLRRRPQDFPLPFRLFTMAVLVSWLLTIKLWNFSAWSITWLLIPGAQGLRVVLRYQLWLILPVLILTAGVWRARFMALLTARPAMTGGIVLLLIAEQLNGATVAELSRSHQRADFARIAPMPAQCPAFYVVSARPARELYRGTFEQAHYPHNVDAMLLAALTGTPTINGFSTFNPPDWNFAEPDAPDYDARVATYARQHNLTILCRLDARTSPQWQIIRYVPHAQNTTNHH